jgi:hypothetical protein
MWRLERAVREGGEALTAVQERRKQLGEGRVAAAAAAAMAATKAAPESEATRELREAEPGAAQGAAPCAAPGGNQAGEVAAERGGVTAENAPTWDRHGLPSLEEQVSEMLETPRRVNERNLIWSDTKRADKRRAVRKTTYDALSAMEKDLKERVDRNERRLYSSFHLPKVQLEILRRPGLSRSQVLDEAIAASRESACAPPALASPRGGGRGDASLRGDLGAPSVAAGAEPGATEPHESAGASPLHLPSSSGPAARSAPVAATAAPVATAAAAAAAKPAVAGGEVGATTAAAATTPSSTTASPAVSAQVTGRPGTSSDPLAERGPFEYRALHLAVLQGAEEAVARLLETPGLEVDAKDHAGYTALHLALSQPHLHRIARMLADAGADLTELNRECLTPVEVALSLRLYVPVTRFLETFSAWELASQLARRFFLNYFAGDPEYHHYRRLDFERGRLIAYVVVMQPQAIKRDMALRARWRAWRGEQQRTLNNTERFFHDYLGRHRFDASWDGQVWQRTIPKKRGLLRRASRALYKRIHHKALARAAALAGEGVAEPEPEAEAKAEAAAKRKAKPRAPKPKPGQRAKSARELVDEAAALEKEEALKKLEQEQAKMRAEPGPAQREAAETDPELARCLGVFREFAPAQVARWRRDAAAWKFDRGTPAVAVAVARHAFAGALSAQEVRRKLAEGRDAFARWREGNAHQLLADEQRRIQEIADAMRLRKMVEERERKAAEAAAQAERELQDRIKRGLANLDENAAVEISDDRLYYEVDAGEPVEYTIRLVTMPVAPVLIRFQIRALGGDSVDSQRSQFTIQPSLTTFTRTDWDKERTVRVKPRDDDAVVRLKRTVTQGGNCDHVVVHAVQNSADPSYKTPALKWVPAKDLKVLCK